MKFIISFPLTTILLGMTVCSGCGGGNDATPAALKAGNSLSTTKTSTGSDETVATPGPAPIELVTVSKGVDATLQQRIKEFGEKLKAAASKKTLDGGLTAEDLQKIATAADYYQDSFQNYPALNGGGTKDFPHPGLSWRVYLLPFLDQAPLYQQFDLHQSWDSEHNKPLIAKMPLIFGKNPEGKTRLHVLTGKGAPFQNDEGPKTDSITDDKTGTILCLVAGEDKAEIWTKPGGLEFDPQAPLKCLGQIGDQIPAVMFDKSVRYFPKSIAPDQFALLVQHADGQTVPQLPPAADKSGDETLPPPKIAAPVTPLAPVSQQLDVRFIPQDAFAALVIHPRRFLNHRVIKAITDQLFDETMIETTQKLVATAQSRQQLLDFCKQAGFAPQDLDEIVFVLDRSLMEPSKDLKEQNQLAGIIARTSSPVEVDAAVAVLSREFPTAEVQQVEGVSLLVVSDLRACIGFVNDSTLVMGDMQFVKKMLAARDQTQPATRLTKRLAAMGNRLLVFAMDSSAVQNSLKTLAAFPGPTAALRPVQNSNEIALSIDLDAPEFFKFLVQFDQPQEAKILVDLFSPQLHQLKARPVGQPVLPFVKLDSGSEWLTSQIVSTAKLEQAAGTFSLTVPRPRELDTLPERLKPALEAAKRAAHESQRLAALREVRSLLFNYETAANGRLPALNGPGQKLSKLRGLSWRVHILRVDDITLYEQFHFEEPWDSPHNMSLIAKMPKMYGNRTDGKTSMHVITGPGAPFQNDEGIRLRDVTDGTDKTLMVVEAGDDVAEIWTKPGGLEFDPVDPLKCLGKSHDFLGLLMDGTAKSFKGLDAETFRKLVQYKDGEEVTVP